MKNKIIFISLCICLVFLLGRCKKVDLSAAYLSLSTDIFQIDLTNYNLINSTSYDAEELKCIASQKFPDVWIFVNGKDLGTWELPCEIPILAQGPTHISIYPGVKLNGSSTSRPRYPFVDSFDTTINLQVGEIHTIEKAPIKYYPTTKFNNVIETFETISNQYFETIDSAGLNFSRIIDTYAPTEHHQVGILTLGNGDSVFNIQSHDLAFRQIPEAVFLEMDYRCDAPTNQAINVGMYIKKINTPVISYEPLVMVNASNEWKKIYINLTQCVLRNSAVASAYRVLLSGGYDGDSPINFYFDNIKVVYL